MMNKKQPLGNGLNKLSDVAKSIADRDLDIAKIYAIEQVRKKFQKLDELAQSIRELGIIEPLVVHAEPGDRYRLIIGERRLRAAPMAGLSKVPVIIKRNLSEEEIRALQVAENNVRDDLTPYEKIMGVVEDVNKFGTKAAMMIWGAKSETWISKRVAVPRYNPITLSILKDELSGDLEILLSINKIESNDPEAAKLLREQLERGEPLHRDTVRDKLSLMELQKKEAEERKIAPVVDISSAKADMAQTPDDADAGVKASAASSESHAVSTRTDQLGTKRPKASVTKLNTSPKTKPVDDADATAAREQTAKGNQLYQQREELFEYGRDNEDSFQNLQSLMTELGYTPDEGEWAMWVGFQDMVLPMLHRLGKERSTAYMKRLLAELKNSNAAELWQSLHPGSSLNDLSERGEPVPPMPAGWKF